MPVTIQADEETTFRGFTAQARRVTEEEEPIGTMLPFDDQSENMCEVHQRIFVQNRATNTTK